MFLLWERKSSSLTIQPFLLYVRGSHLALLQQFVLVFILFYFMYHFITSVHIPGEWEINFKILGNRSTKNSLRKFQDSVVSRQESIVLQFLKEKSKPVAGPPCPEPVSGGISIENVDSETSEQRKLSEGRDRVRCALLWPQYRHHRCSVAIA